MSTPSLEIQTQEPVETIETADWVLSAQLKDARIKEIKEVLSRPLDTEEDVQNYCVKSVMGMQLTTNPDIAQSHVQKYILNCIPCHYNKKSSGKKEFHTVRAYSYEHGPH